MRNTLQNSFSVDLPATMALDYPTAAAIATHIASLLPPQLGSNSASAKAAPMPQRPPAGVQLLRPASFAQRRQPRTPVTSVMVGLSARFPGAALDAAGVWNNINASIDLPEQVSAAR